MELIHTKLEDSKPYPIWKVSTDWRKKASDVFKDIQPMEKKRASDVLNEQDPLYLKRYSNKPVIRKLKEAGSDVKRTRKAIVNKRNKEARTPYEGTIERLGMTTNSKYISIKHVCR